LSEVWRLIRRDVPGKPVTWKIVTARTPTKYNPSDVDVVVSTIGGERESQEQRARMASAAPEMAAELLAIFNQSNPSNAPNIGRVLKKAGVL
jgi:hypothetical protein